MSIILKNAFVIRDFDSDPEQMDIEIKEGRIKRIQKDIKSQNYIDLTGKMIMPGFVNTHTHAAMVLARGIADNVPFDKWLYEFVIWGTTMGLGEILLFSICTFIRKWWLKLL